MGPCKRPSGAVLSEKTWNYAKYREVTDPSQKRTECRDYTIVAGVTAREEATSVGSGRLPISRFFAKTGLKASPHLGIGRPARNGDCPECRLAGAGLIDRHPGSALIVRRRRHRPDRDGCPNLVAYAHKRRPIRPEIPQSRRPRVIGRRRARALQLLTDLRVGVHVREHPRGTHTRRPVQLPEASTPVEDLTVPPGENLTVRRGNGRQGAVSE